MAWHFLVGSAAEPAAGGQIQGFDIPQSSALQVVLAFALALL